MLFLPPKTAVLILLSTSMAAVVVVATMLLPTHRDHNLHPPATATTTSQLLSFLHGISSWLTPPYLYLVVNAIIISILASSKLHSKTAAASPGDAVDIGRRPILLSPGYGGLLETDGKSSGSGTSGGLDDRDQVEGPVEKATEEEDMPEPVVATAAGDDDDPGGRVKEEKEDREAKPPVSSRFVSRQSALPPANGAASNFSTPPTKGGSKAAAAAAALVISKSARRNDTLESTWKMITEGRHVPLTRHLKKSDTWNSNHVAPPSSAGKVMKKSETFRQGKAAAAKRNSATSSSATVLKREPSLSQEELNLRVEAFINNFNEEMRLQRQESLNRYKEFARSGGVFSF